MFTNITAFRLPPDFTLSASDLEQALQRAELRECSALQEKSAGFLAVADDRGMVASVNGALVIRYGEYKRVLPAKAVSEEVEKRVKKLEAETQFPVGRKKKRDIKDEVIVQMLPKAFQVRKDFLISIDASAGWLIVDSGSAGAAEDAVERLRATLEQSLEAVNLCGDGRMVNAMTQWLGDGVAPGRFEIGEAAELISTEGGRKARFSGHDLSDDLVSAHLKDGKVVSAMEVTFDDSFSFTVTAKGEFKRLKPFGDAEDEGEESGVDPGVVFDAELTLAQDRALRILQELESCMELSRPLHEMEAAAGASNDAEACAEAA